MTFSLQRLSRAEYRNARLSEESPDQRSPGQRDRDRILYTSALRRLASVTQVAGGFEGHVFHNRLTHTLEVAQIARRLAEKLLRDAKPLARRLGGIDPDVVEAAALAHDLGHPPFGHIAEVELDRVALETDPDSDGFEGNAQSFRILTKISAHRTEYSGLNLTRATLNAALKYPTHRVMDKGYRAYWKFGAYKSEAAEFRFAREGFGDLGCQSVEASIMDVADDIAYSVHDLDDFYRAGLIPIGELQSSPVEFDEFLQRWISSPKLEAAESAQILDRKESLRSLLGFVFPQGRYIGSDRQRKLLRRASSSLIGDFINSVTLLEEPNGKGALAAPDPAKRLEMQFLQRLVWHYVIDNPRLATQQEGQRITIRALFKTYYEAIRNQHLELLPPRYRSDADALVKQKLPEKDERSAAVRIAIDIVAQFADAQAVSMYRRILGIAPGSVVDMLHA